LLFLGVDYWGVPATFASALFFLFIFGEVKLINAVKKTESENASEDRLHKVLILDDYFLVRHNHKLLLQKLGFGVIEGNNGEEGLQILETKGADNFDLIIVDLMMPVMDGAEFIKAAREKYGDILPPIFVCSSTSELPVVREIVALGVADYIIKPVDFNVFIGKLKQMFPDVVKR
jgi:two-component system chemotaxis response regulator CheY